MNPFRITEKVTRVILLVCLVMFLVNTPLAFILALNGLYHPWVINACIALSPLWFAAVLITLAVGVEKFHGWWVKRREEWEMRTCDEFP